MHPRLAKLAFDDDRYSVELKLDGVRAQCHIDRREYRLLTRSRRDVTANYPEFSFLASLPPGTVLDGEIVVMSQGRPSLHSVMMRDRVQFDDNHVVPDPVVMYEIAIYTPMFYVRDDDTRHCTRPKPCP